MEKSIPVCLVFDEEVVLNIEEDARDSQSSNDEDMLGGGDVVVVDSNSDYRLFYMTSSFGWLNPFLLAKL